MAENTSVCYAHRHLCETIRLAWKLDGLNILNCAFIEHTIRRLIQIERAVKRNPRSPDFSGLDLVVATGVDSRGASRTQGFDDFITEKQAKQAYVLKQTRLYSEEQDKSRKNNASSSDAPPKAPKPKRPKGKGAGKGQEE